MMRAGLAHVVIAAVGWAPIAETVEPNPPVWADSVRVFSPDDTDIQQVVDAAFARNGGHQPPDKGQFSSARFAFLFKPGRYPQDVPVGFYTTVHGLGDSPNDVVFDGPKGVYCEEGDYNATTGALDNFWRGAENFRSSATHAWQTGTGMLWAVSQASPLRRLHVDHDLVLYQYEPPYAQAGYASGGFLADAVVEGNLSLGSQQQWLSRNVHMPPGATAGAVWNGVFVGCVGAPSAHCGLGERGRDHSNVVVERTPLVAEKPYIIVGGGDGSIEADADRFSLVVPARASGTVGASWAQAAPSPPRAPPPEVIDFSRVYVARAEVDTADSINEKLRSPSIRAVVLCPGVYALSSPLTLTTNQTILLGLGLATLVPTGAQPVVSVVGAGSTVAGVLLQAGPHNASALLTVGQSAAGASLHDVYARVGGPDVSPVSADAMVHVHADGVIGDNLWLWRADHTVHGAVRGGANPCRHGLVVGGRDVKMYGLAVEHTLADLTVWSGEAGETYFYQSELPYDVTHEAFGAKGYAGYRVADGVSAHEAHGVGVYHYFRDYAVQVTSGIVAPPSASFHFPLGVYLDGLGSMAHVLNGEGNATRRGGTHVAYVCA